MSLITLPALLFRRREDTPMPEIAEVSATPVPSADEPIVRFLTLGGAVVGVRKTRFVTRWRSCPPFAADRPYAIDGYQWKCAGCGSYGREGDTYNDPGYRREKEARDEANSHAERCRAMPKPDGAV